MTEPDPPPIEVPPERIEKRSQDAPSLDVPDARVAWFSDPGENA